MGVSGKPPDITDKPPLRLLLPGGITMAHQDWLWAAHAGHFAHFKVTPSLEPIPSPREALRMVALGQATLTRASLLDVLDMLPRAPQLRVIGVTHAQLHWQVVSLAGLASASSVAALANLVQLTGKTVGVAAEAGTASEHLRVALRLSGMDANTVRMVAVGSGEDAVNALANGKIDALLAAPMTRERISQRKLNTTEFTLAAHLPLPAQVLVTHAQALSAVAGAQANARTGTQLGVQVSELVNVLAAMRRAVRELHRVAPLAAMTKFAQAVPVAGKRNLAFMVAHHNQNLADWQSAGAVSEWLGLDASAYTATIDRLIAIGELDAFVAKQWPMAVDTSLALQSRVVLAATDEPVAAPVKTPRRAGVAR
jgi:hypothetical protein